LLSAAERLRSTFSKPSLRSLRLKEDGVTMIEFALVAPIFLMLLFAGLEYGIVTYIGGTLGTVVNDAGGLGMTGGNYADLQDPTAPSKPRDVFLKEIITKRLGPLAEMGKITITPTPYASLSGMNTGGGTTNGFGSGGQVVVYDVIYEWKILTPIVGNFMGQDGIYNIHSRTVMQNEEF
jgi:Flp pilus assembly pilin Flp